MIFSRDVIFREFRANSEDVQPKEKSKIVHFETKQEDAHVEEQRDGQEDGEEEESSDESVVTEEVENNEDEHEEESLTPPLRRSTRQ